MNGLELLAFVGFTAIFNGAQGQLCVLPGTCTTPPVIPPPAPGTGQIDVRIVTPTASTAPNTCPPGLVLCTGQVAVQCGVRYVSPVVTNDGQSTAGAHPWLAYITNQTSFTGGGVLLDANHVLTAAHKVEPNRATPGNIRVMLGVWDPTNLASAQNRTAVSIIIHPLYVKETLFNDIAIVRLNAPAILATQPTVNTGCLPTQGASFVGQNCMVAGWGQTQFTVPDSPSRPQKQVTVPIVTYQVCRTSFSAPNVLSTNVDKFLDPVGEICAGGAQSRDACTNDGGSPLMCADATGKYTVAGLVIWGKGCGQPGVYGVYANVAYYRNWIDTVIAGSNAG